MNPTCPFCTKELTLDNDHIQITMGAVGNGIDTLSKYELYVCHLCQSPVYDSMYKELYSRDSMTLIIDGVRGETIVTKKLLVKAALIDEFYVIVGTDYHLGHKRNPFTSIYKNIIGTVGHSIDFEPITANKPVLDLDYILDLPFDNIPALKNKLQTYTVFS